MVNRTLKARIIEKYGTQSDFADAVKKWPPFVSNVIRNRVKLDPDSQRIWAKKLESDVNEIFPEN